MSDGDIRKGLLFYLYQHMQSGVSEMRFVDAAWRRQPDVFNECLVSNLISVRADGNDMILSLTDKGAVTARLMGAGED